MSMNIWRLVQLLVLFFILTLNSQCNGYYQKGNNHQRGHSYGHHDFELSIIHMNDFHARFEEINRKGNPCEHYKGQHCYGGLARTLTAVHQIKNKQPNSIFLNAGDHYHGTLWYNMFKWDATAKFLNMMEHDVMTIGNHDFDGGVEGLVPFLTAVKPNVPVVLSNVDLSTEPSLQNLMERSTIINRNGKRIGVIGVIYRNVWRKATAGNLQFWDEIRSVNSEADKLKRQGVDIIVVLSHCGIKIDKKIAKSCPDVDIIVGGHSHTFLYTGTPPFEHERRHRWDKYPIVVKQGHRKVLIVQAYAFTKYLGHLTVWFDGHGEVKSWKGNPILLDNTIPEDKNMLGALQPYKNALHKKTSQVVGNTKNKLENDCKFGECTIGNMITDAMVASSNINHKKGNDWTYAAIAINYVAFIDKSINPYKGSIKYGDLWKSQLFENTWDVVAVEGKYIREALEWSFKKTKQGKYRSSFVWSGIDVVVDTSKSTGKAIVEMRVRCQDCSQPTYHQLRDDRWYRVVVPSFMFHKGGSSIIAKKGNRREIGPINIDALAEFVSNKSPLNYQKEDRVYFCDRSRNKSCGINYRSHSPRLNDYLS